jgi:hypothetical protein
MDAVDDDLFRRTVRCRACRLWFVNALLDRRALAALVKRTNMNNHNDNPCSFICLTERERERERER